MTSTKTTSKQRSFNKPAFIPNPLPILYSCRIRLTPAERDEFKAAYKEAESLEHPMNQPTVGNSSVSSQTTYGSSPQLEAKLGMQRMVTYDIINSRDSISLPIILKLQSVLGVEVITPARLQGAFDSYVKYMFSQNE